MSWHVAAAGLQELIPQAQEGCQHPEAQEGCPEPEAWWEVWSAYLASLEACMSALQQLAMFSIEPASVGPAVLRAPEAYSPAQTRCW